MLLFKEEHVGPIQERRKTQTRRLWKSWRVKVGHVYQARTRMLDKSSTFAYLRIKRVWLESDVKQISREDALAEGYNSPWNTSRSLRLSTQGCSRLTVPYHVGLWSSR